MRRRDLTALLLLPVLATACAPPPLAPTANLPPPGTESAQPAFPRSGAKWRVRVTESRLFGTTVEEHDIQATPTVFQNRPALGLTGPRATTALDPASFNPVGAHTNGVTTATLSPAEGPLVWPLWVGKVWAHTYAASDLVYGQVWPAARATGQVAAMETVTVRAGVFRAYRIEYKAGLGTGTLAARDRDAVLGIETVETHWYAPAVKLVVKSIVRRAPVHHLGVGTTTTELVRPPA